MLLSFGLNARMAANPRSDYQSADERSYGKLAVDIADRQHYGGASTGMREPLHWPPGAPVLFAVGLQAVRLRAGREDLRHPRRLLGAGADHDRDDRARGRARVDARRAVGRAARGGDRRDLPAADRRDRRPALRAARRVPAARRVRRARARAEAQDSARWYAAAGALFGLTILTRTDLLAVPFLIAGLGGADRAGATPALRVADRCRWWLVAIAARSCSRRGRSTPPREEGRFIPVTKGSAAALFVGTYLPGGGTTIGMKEHLEPQLRARHPEYNGIKTYKIPAADALAAVRRQAPGPPARRGAQQGGQARTSIHYSTTQPVAFVQMQWAKAKRMWFFYYRGGGVHYISTPMRIWQVVLVLACGLGLLAGLIRRRDPLLGAVLLTIAFSTLIHTIVVSQARYNVPLMPSLIAAGVAGWFLALRSAAREAARAAEPTATMPRMELGQIGIWRAKRHGASGVIARDRGARLRRVLDRRQPVASTEARAVPGGGEHAARRHRHPQRLAARPRGRRARPRQAHARLPGPLPARHRHRPPRGDQRLHAPAEDDARVLRRPGRAETPCRRTSALAAALGPKMLDLAEERSLGTHPYFIDVRAHPLRPRARGGGRAGRPRGRRRGRAGPRDRPQDRPRVRRSSTSA